MGTKISAATPITNSGFLSGDKAPLSRADGSKGYVDLFALLPPQFAFTSAGATGAKVLTIGPAFPAANAGSYQLGVATAANGTPDEALSLGYNVYGAIAAEPRAGLILEVNWVTTARGVASQRTMELYTQFAGRGASSPANAPRGLFHSFEPADTSFGSSHYGEILYGYLSAGYNRYGAQGGGGFSITTDGNDNTPPLATFDLDGPRMYGLRSCDDIGVFTAFSAANPLTFTIPLGSGLRPGAVIQIYKPVTAGWQAAWHSSAIVLATVVTATDGATTSIVTNLNATGFGIDATYGWQLAVPSASKRCPAFMGLSVGTSAAASQPFTFTLAGDFGGVGKFCVAEEAMVGSLTRAPNSGDFPFPAMFNFLSKDSTASGKHQVFAFSNSVIQFAMGYPTDSLSNYMFAIGGAQATDANFTAARAALIIGSDGGLTPTNSIGIDGKVPWNIAKLCLPACNATYAHISMPGGSAKTTPVDGDFWHESGSPGALKFCDGSTTRTINWT